MTSTVALRCSSIALILTGACAAPPAEDVSAQGDAVTNVQHYGVAQTVVVHATDFVDENGDRPPSSGLPTPAVCGGVLVGPKTVFTLKKCLQRSEGGVSYRAPANEIVVESPYPRGAHNFVKVYVTAIEVDEVDAANPFAALALEENMTKKVSPRKTQTEPVDPFAASVTTIAMDRTIENQELPSMSADGIAADGVLTRERGDGTQVRTSRIATLEPAQNPWRGGRIVMNRDGSGPKTWEPNDGHRPPPTVPSSLEAGDVGGLLYRTHPYSYSLERNTRVAAYGLLDTIEGDEAFYVRFSPYRETLEAWYSKIESTSPTW